MALYFSNEAFEESLAASSHIHVKSGLTAEKAVMRLAKANDLSLSVRKAEPDEGYGAFVKYNNHGTPAIALKNGILSSSTIAAVAIAGHEVGHAINYPENMALDVITRTLSPTVPGSLLLVLWVSLAGIFSRRSRYHCRMALLLAIYISLLCTTGSVLETFEEFQASAAGLASLQRERIIAADEIPTARSILICAGGTYASTMATYVFSLGGLIFLLRNT